MACCPATRWPGVVGSPERLEGTGPNAAAFGPWVVRLDVRTGQDDVPAGDVVRGVSALRSQLSRSESGPTMPLLVAEPWPK